MAYLLEHSLFNNSARIEDVTSSGANKFLSLKWKVLLLSSLVLLAIVASFCTISYLTLVGQFEEQRDAQHQRHEKELQGLIEQTSQSLHQLAGTIPLLDDMDAGLLMSNADGITQAFDQHWALLQLHSGIELVRFYSKSNQLLSS